MKSDGYGFTILPKAKSNSNMRSSIIRSKSVCVFGSNNELEINEKEVLIKRMKHVIGGIGIAVTATVTATGLLSKPAVAMGPNLAGPSMQKEVTGMELAEKMAQLRAARKIAADKKLLDDQGTKIFKENGSEAYEEFLKEIETKRVAEKGQREVEREELIRDLILVQEVDPYKSLKGKAALYMFDKGIDLYKVPGTEQEAFERLKKMFPEKYGDVEIRQKEATRAKVNQLRDQGFDDDQIVDQFMLEGDKLAKIGDGRGRDLHDLQSRRDKRNKKTIPLPPKKESVKVIQPQTTAPSTEDIEVDEDKQKEELKAAKQKQKEDAKAAKAQAKEKAKLEAEQKKKLAKEQKAEEKAAKAEAKALKQKEKAEAKAAAKIAAATAIATSAAVTSLPSPDLTTTTTTTTTTETPTAIEKEEIVSETTIDETNESTEEEIAPSEPQIVTPPKDSVLTANNYKIPKIVAGTSFIGASSFVSIKFYNERSKQKELERQRQFDLLMGNTASEVLNDPSPSPPSIILDQPSPAPEPIALPTPAPAPAPVDPYANVDPNSEVDIQTPKPQFLTKKNTSPPVQPQETKPSPSSSSLPSSHDKNKGRGGTIANLFKKKSSDKRPATLSKVFASTSHSNFAQTLSQVLTLGAPGRFPDINPPQPPNESLQVYKDNLINVKANIPIDQTADVFANVVNSMLIHIVDLASSTVVTKNKNPKKKSENDKIVVEGVSVVLDFMDFSAQLYEELFNDYPISPVTYSGTLSKSKLENLFSTYATSQMTNFETGLADNQDRVDTLQRVFNIPDKRAEGLLQKTLMKNFMSMMKDGDADGGAMAEMMKGLAGDGAPFPGQDGTDVNPEDIQQSIKLMKELMESGSISKEEIALVKDQFSEVYGTDINKFMQEAEGEEDNLDEDGKELLNLFKDVLKE